jgi:uncharacterized C2H2 Zn-finger protein
VSDDRRAAPEEKVPFVAAGEAGGGATRFECGLCGLVFSHGDEACGSCALGGCDLVRCPRCGYQFPRSSRVVDLVGRLLGRPRRNA